ncbi:hypothetical protein [Jannaschia sp. M317]|uniref:hypothetical protein n=1 Tax=Jannaschia sp. M317 TaxID=2867011 RepID=UPI0021A33DFB|nr:hypothetical protein [Jannaschia sp. M317]UWQ16535.1 hypothetical protein K3551_11480 [Jannaschia sp. M317]
MTRAMLWTAIITGLFCVGFSIVIALVTRVIGTLPVEGISFVSGFLGSLIAQTIVARIGAGK